MSSNVFTLIVCVGGGGGIHQRQPELTLRLTDVLQNSLHQKHGVSFSKISSVQRSLRGAQPPLAVSTKPSSEEEEGKGKKG